MNTTTKLITAAIAILLSSTAYSQTFSEREPANAAQSNSSLTTEDQILDAYKELSMGKGHYTQQERDEVNAYARENGLRPVKPALDFSLKYNATSCKSNADACVSAVAGGAAACAAYAWWTGAVVETGCLAAAAIETAFTQRATCTAMVRDCNRAGSAASPSISALASNGPTGTAATPAGCVSPHKVSAVRLYRASSSTTSLVYGVEFNCSDGKKLLAGKTTAYYLTASCGAGKVAQGYKYYYNSNNRQVGIGFICDDPTTTNGIDGQHYLQTLGPNAADRICAEGKYLSAMVAHTKRSDGTVSSYQMGCTNWN